MGYNWLYVNGMIYYKMFNDAKYYTSDFKSTDDEFEFKIKIPKQLEWFLKIIFRIGLKSNWHIMKI